MNSSRRLAAAAGAGFYRYWHVPHPDGDLDIRTTRRADLSVIGPGALALVALAAWVSGRVGTSLLLDERVAATVDALPWGGRMLVLAGYVGVVLAATWWLGTAPVRTRVARGVAQHRVVRIPDNPDGSSAQLHAAASLLGHTLRNLPEGSAPADEAFALLRTAVAALDGEVATPEQQGRLRRRCLATAQRLGTGAEDGPVQPPHGHAAA